MGGAVVVPCLISAGGLKLDVRMCSYQRAILSSLAASFVSCYMDDMRMCHPPPAAG